MGQQDDYLDRDISRANGSAGPAGRPKPLPAEDFDMVPGKGNLGGPGNHVANEGVGAELPHREES